MASHFNSKFQLDMLDRELAVKVVENELDLKALNLSLQGWNWGVANFNGGVIHFEVSTDRSAPEMLFTHDYILKI